MKRVIMPVQQAQCGRLVLVNDKHGLNGVSGRFLELEDIGASPWGESVLLESEAAAWLIYCAREWIPFAGAAAENLG